MYSEKDNSNRTHGIILIHNHDQFLNVIDFDEKEISIFNITVYEDD